MALPEIMEACLRIIDKEGLDALTMRRLADELEIGTMTVYAYFKNKEELLDHVATEILGDIPKHIPATGSWEERLMNTMGQLQAALHDHPGIAALTMSRRGPIAALDPFREAILSILRDAGFPIPAAVDALSALVIYVAGYHVVEHARSDADIDRESQRLAQLSPSEFPNLSAAAEDYAHHVSKRTFDAGLRSLIDGLVAELAAFTPRRSGRITAKGSKRIIGDSSP